MDRLKYIEECEKLSSLDELIEKVSIDAKSVTPEDSLFYNFIRAFNWFLVASDHNTRPVGLLDYFTGLGDIDLFEQMKTVYNKLKLE